ncbi:MAG: hypothetical protein PHU08_01635 [Dehalococcoidales bacterium]|nr:hypothetical protein [Dehalococcoidales bacterium]
MKFSRITWIVLAVGIVVVVLGSLGAVYVRQSNEQEELSNNLATVQATLPPLITEKADWGAKLAQYDAELTDARTQLGIARARFPRAAVESIETDEKLYAIADKCSIEIVELGSPPPHVLKDNNITYFITQFSANVEGPVTNILSFIDTVVADGSFATATADLVTIDVPPPLTPEEKEGLTPAQIAEIEMPTAQIRLTIYGYQSEGE